MQNHCLRCSSGQSPLWFQGSGSNQMQPVVISTGKVSQEPTHSMLGPLPVVIFWKVLETLSGDSLGVLLRRLYLVTCAFLTLHFLSPMS